MNTKQPNLLEILKDSGINIRKLAKDVGIPEQRIYAWINKGSRPKMADEEKVREYLDSKYKTTNQSQPIKPPDDYEAVISVLLSRVSELLALKNGSSSVVELTQMQKDVEQLKKLKS